MQTCMAIKSIDVCITFQYIAVRKSSVEMFVCKSIKNRSRKRAAFNFVCVVLEVKYVSDYIYDKV